MKYINPVLSSFVQLLLLNPALTLSHWPILRGIILKYYLHNRMLNGTSPMMKLLLRTTSDIVPHLLKKGTRSSRGYPNCSAICGLQPSISRAEELALSSRVGAISLDRAVRVLHVEGRGSPPGQRASSEFHGDVALCPEFMDHIARCVTLAWESLKMTG